MDKGIEKDVEMLVVMLGGLCVRHGGKKGEWHDMAARAAIEEFVIGLDGGPDDVEEAYAWLDAYYD